MIFLCLISFSSNFLLHYHFGLHFLKSLYDTMLKRYQKVKKEILYHQMHWGGGGGAKSAKTKEKMSKTEFSVLIISICRIFPKMFYNFLP